MSTYERDRYEKLLREERYKQLLARYGSQDIPGMVGHGTPDGRSSIVAKRNAIAGGTPGTPDFHIRPRAVATGPATPEQWGVQAVARRNANERVESMTRRLWDQIQANPRMAAAILKDYQLELWRQGTPVSYDDLKKVAIELLTEAERQQRIKQKSYQTR